MSKSPKPDIRVGDLIRPLFRKTGCPLYRNNCSLEPSDFLLVLKVLPVTLWVLANGEEMSVSKDNLVVMQRYDE